LKLRLELKNILMQLQTKINYLFLLREE